jgi:hypothetical protein
MRDASARRFPDEPLCEPSMQLCEHSVLRQLRDERRLSFANDNCQRNSARVNSTSLYKGITVERRRRKASGPARARAQDSGVAGRDFITKRLSSPSAVYSCCASPSASASSPCDDAALRAARFTRCASRRRRTGAAQIEMGKPVERRGRKASGLLDLMQQQVQRQRGCRMNRVGPRNDASCVDRRFIRGRARVRSQASDLSSRFSDECVSPGRHPRNVRAASCRSRRAREQRRESC